MQREYVDKMWITLKYFEYQTKLVAFETIQI